MSLPTTPSSREEHIKQHSDIGMKKLRKGPGYSSQRLAYSLESQRDKKKGTSNKSDVTGNKGHMVAKDLLRRHPQGSSLKMFPPRASFRKREVKGRGTQSRDLHIHWNLKETKRKELLTKVTSQATRVIW
jgi:hypothetical protein